MEIDSEEVLLVDNNIGIKGFCVPTESQEADLIQDENVRMETESQHYLLKSLYIVI